MKFLPYESFSIISDFKPNEVLSKMRDVIFVHEAERPINSDYDVYSTKYFVGNVSKDGFDIKPDITYRNSFLPNIKGEVKEYDNGSKIQVKMVVAPAFLGFVCLAFMFMLIATVTNLPNKPGYEILTILSVSLFLYFIVMISFKSESKKAIDTLLDVFEGEIQ